MEKGSKRNGSIIVMVLMIGTFIMVVASVALRSGTLLYELALDRVTYLKQLHAAQALAYYGIAYCKMRKEEKRESHSLSFAHWPLPSGPYEGSITIEPIKKGYIVAAILLRQNEELCSIQAEIECPKEEWRIVSWQSG